MEPLAPASPWLLAQRERIVAAARRGPVVELACGRGRIALRVAGWGLRVVGIDRDRGFLDALRERARVERTRVDAVRADLEGPGGLPLAAGRCGVLLVFRYLHRPLAPAIAEALAPGGLLVYETFTHHQRELGYGPENTDFLLGDDELAGMFPSLATREAWEGVSDEPRPAAVARLAAERPLR